MVLTNAVRFSDEPTLVENERPPVQPPTESMAFTVLFLATVTSWVRSSSSSEVSVTLLGASGAVTL